jgi:hypothetical protein
MKNIPKQQKNNEDITFLVFFESIDIKTYHCQLFAANQFLHEESHLSYQQTSQVFKISKRAFRFHIQQITTETLQCGRPTILSMEEIRIIVEISYQRFMEKSSVTYA